MSSILYNGLTMSLIQTRRWEQLPIKVGQDIAGFRYTVTVLANLNTNTLGPVADRTARGLVIWNSLRERLMAQRRNFTMTVGNVIIASFPATPSGTSVDTELGPKPLACNVIQFNGGGSVLVEYTIQWTQPNPCAGGKTGSDGMAVLAHVWGSDDDLDKDFFVTRTYRGRIHLNPLVAGPAGSIHPDALRGAMFPALAGPLRREDIKARISEDGYTYDYVIKDVQPYQLVASTEITRMVATHLARHTVPTPAEYMAAAGQAIGAVGGVAGAGSGRGGALAAVGALPSLGQAYWSTLPMVAHSFEATAFGHNGTTYATLASAARAVCLWRLMKYTGVGITDPWGGSAETVNNSEPRSVTFRMEIIRRPRELQQWRVVDGGGQGRIRLENLPATAEVWRLGQNDMPTITAPGTVVNAEIRTPTGIPIPDHIKQLVYGATPGYLPGDWNGPTQINPPGLPSGGSFAPDLMTTNPDGPRTNYPWGTGAFTSNLFSLALVSALQDPCAYKTAVTFPPQTYRTTPASLPGV